MYDETVIHRHQGDDQTMVVEREQTIDGLLVRQYQCVCGEERVLLAPRHGTEIGPSWPIPWLAKD